MITTYDPTKLQERLHGPYRIVETRTNGTVRVRMREPNIDETFNIRKLRPYKGPPAEMQQVLRERERQNHEYQEYAKQQGLLLPNAIGPLANI